MAGTVNAGAVNTGGLAFTGTGNRITGDFSNATVANRVMFRTSTVNGASVVGVIPNGTQTYSEVSLYNAQDTGNASKFDFSISGTLARIRNLISGTGSYVPLSFEVGGAERMRIDASGNVLATSPGGLGYGTGAGGTVTQATSKATAVTLNKPCGQITMHNAALAAGASVTFVLNSLPTVIGVGDVCVCNVTYASTGSLPQNYQVSAANITPNAPQFFFTLKNVSAGSLSDAVVINFTIIKGATS